MPNQSRKKTRRRKAERGRPGRHLPPTTTPTVSPSGSIDPSCSTSAGKNFFVLAVLFIIVIGPKDMPGAVRAITKWIRKARSMARDLQDGLDEVAREADLEDLKNEIGGPGGLDIAKRIGDAVDPTGDIAADMDLDKDDGQNHQPVPNAKRAHIRILAFFIPIRWRG